jgi:hypothetical protein
MTTLLHSRADTLSTASPAQGIRRSRALASMLPAFVVSGVITCVMAAIMRLLVDTGPSSLQGFFGDWIEAWLTSWAIAFPITYLIGPALVRVSLRWSAAAIAPAAATTTATASVSAPRYQRGLGLGDAKSVSDKVTARNGLPVLRLVKSDNHAV